MKRRWFLAMGTALLVGVGVLTAALGESFWLDPAFAIQGALLVVGGAAFVIAGLGGSPFGLDTIQVVGVGDVCVAAMLLANALQTVFGGSSPGAADFIVAATLGLSGLLLGAIGIDYLRGGVYFDGDAFEDGSLVE